MQYRLIEYHNREIEQVDDDFLLLNGIMRGLLPYIVRSVKQNVSKWFHYETLGKSLIVLLGLELMHPMRRNGLFK